MLLRKNMKQNKKNKVLKTIKKVVVIGLGYVGLPTMVAINKTDLYETLGFDVDKNKIKKIKSGLNPVEDKDVTLYLRDFKLNVTSLESKLIDHDVFIICVPTPVDEDYEPNYTIVEKAVSMVSKYLKKGNHIVLESTVNPGTCEERLLPIIEKISGLKVGKDINLAHCPERINPGDPRWTVYNINRNIGSINKTFNKQIADFYRTFIIDAKVNEVNSLKVAEATKIIENTFRDINIAYVNELAMSFDAMGIDLKETIEAASNKPFAFMPHWPGCGVGGHCIAVDPYYLIKRAALSGFDHRFLKVAREINNGMPQYTVNKLIKEMENLKMPLKKTKVVLLGLTYKANIGDLRESPSLKIKEILESMGVDLMVYDPYVKSDFNNLLEAVNGSRAIIIGTAHQEFINNLPPILEKSKVKIIIDGKNCLDKNEIIKKNIVYKGIGR